MLRSLGKGAMGVVYEANHRALNKRVAIKVLHEQHAGDAGLMRRFAREAAAVSALQSRYVVRVFDSDKTAEGAPFIVMEMLSGRDMAAVLRKERPPVERVVDWLVQICSAMYEAHSLGIIHRDLKPSNVFIADPDASVRVLDFGISRLVAGNELTVGPEILGTPNYIAPEVLQGAAADARSDLYAIGVIAYRALSGRFPCEAPKDDANQFSAMIATVTVPPTPILERVPELPVELADAVMKTLSKDPSKRFSSARELAMAIQRFGTSAAHFEELTKLGDTRPVTDPSSLPPADPTLSVDVDLDATEIVSMGAQGGAVPSSDVAATDVAASDVDVDVEGTRSPRGSRRLALAGAAVAGVVIAGAAAALIARTPSSAGSADGVSEVAAPAASTLAPSAAPAASTDASSAAPAASADASSAAPATSAAAPSAAPPASAVVGASAAASAPSLAASARTAPSARPKAVRAPAPSTSAPPRQKTDGPRPETAPAKDTKTSPSEERLYLD